MCAVLNCYVKYQVLQAKLNTVDKSAQCEMTIDFAGAFYVRKVTENRL